MTMRALLFTTCDFGSPRLDHFKRLTDSLESTARSSQHEIVHFVLMQRATVEALASYVEADTRYRQFMYCTSGRLSISAARNALLTIARDSGWLEKGDWIAFPDDDAWYPAGVVDRICEEFAQHDVDVVTCQYSQLPVTAEQAPPFKRRTDVFRLVTVFSSNTLFVRRSSADAAGLFFDERLGLGAPINGGEDLDYALRAAGESHAISYCAAPLVGHRDRLEWVRSRYYQGSVCALARSAATTGAFRLAGLRKVAVGLYLILKRELTPLQFAQSLRLSAGFFRRPEHIETAQHAVREVRGATQSTSAV